MGDGIEDVVSLAERSDMRGVMAGYGPSTPATEAAAMPLGATVTTTEAVGATELVTTPDRSEPVPQSMPSPQDSLRKVLEDSDFRMAYLRIGFSRLALRREGVELDDIVASHVQAVMDEHRIGPHSPYVTHHAVADVARQAVREALAAIQSIHNGVNQTQ